MRKCTGACRNKSQGRTFTINESLQGCTSISASLIYQSSKYHFKQLKPVCNWQCPTWWCQPSPRHPQSSQLPAQNMQPCSDASSNEGCERGLQAYMSKPVTPSILDEGEFTVDTFNDRCACRLSRSPFTYSPFTVQPTGGDIIIQTKMGQPHYIR